LDLAYEDQLKKIWIRPEVQELLLTGSASKGRSAYNFYYHCNAPSSGQESSYICKLFI
jgi:hypothetical protein